jgi:AraC-like DNA-binding protein
VLTVPLPFLSGLVFALVLHQSLKGVEVAGSRRFFIAFIVLYAAQGLIVGLHFGYGITALAPVQPVTAALMPPLALLAFQGLTGRHASRSTWLHLLAPASVLVAMAFVRPLVDPLLLAVFLGYGVAIWRLTMEGGEEAMAEASLQRMRPALRAARLTAALMFFFAASDAALSVYAGLYGNNSVPLAVGIMNIVALVAVCIYYFAPQGRVGRPVEEAGLQPLPDDEDVVARAAAALDEADLYRNEYLSLAKLARAAGVPARELSTAINRARGINVSQFVNNRRIEEACRLLQESDRSATAIMLEAGFSTKSNFNREFRRVTGQSPRQWRAASRIAAMPRNNSLDLRGSRQQLGNVQR